jgi:glycosyltransferase involved in cell wall biosynthesis
VEDGRTGFLVPHGDVDALATRIQEVIGNAALRERLSQQAVVFAQRFTWDRAARETEEFLERIRR